MKTFGSSSTSQQASSTQQSCVTREAKICLIGNASKSLREWLYEVKGANKDKTDRQFTGTYVPQELILEIASWVSIEFYDKCNKIILNYFVNEFKKMNKSALEEKIKQVEQLEEQMESLETVKIKDDKIDQLLESNSLFWNRRNIRNKR